MTPLQIVYPDTALRLQALLDFQEEGEEKRVAGDEWLFEGPGTRGRRDVPVPVPVPVSQACPPSATRLSPLSTGTYIPRKEVVVLETIKATVIRENQAIRLRARKEGVDRGGVHRVTGEEGSPPQRLLLA